MNSFSNMQKAIEFEFDRQVRAGYGRYLGQEHQCQHQVSARGAAKSFLRRCRQGQGAGGGVVGGRSSALAFAFQPVQFSNAAVADR